MALTVHSLKIKTYRDVDGWVAVIWIEGVWHGRMTGFATSAEARTAIRRKYL